jgi:hypothetical protein
MLCKDRHWVTSFGANQLKPEKAQIAPGAPIDVGPKLLEDQRDPLLIKKYFKGLI